jgi:hypothetical protein
MRAEPLHVRLEQCAIFLTDIAKLQKWSRMDPSFQPVQCVSPFSPLS